MKAKPADPTKPRMVKIDDGPERDALIAQEGELGCPMLYRDSDGVVYAATEELSAWRALRESGAREQ